MHDIPNNVNVIDLWTMSATLILHAIFSEVLQLRALL